MRQTVKYLIEDGLGYCCQYAFWSAMAKKETALIAARLGVTERAVRKARAAFREEMFDCEASFGCLEERLKLQRTGL